MPDAPVRLLIVMDRPQAAGGAERRLLTVLREIDRTRVAPELVVFGEGEVAEVARETAVPVTVIPDARLRQLHRSVANIARLVRIYRARRPDLILHWLARGQLHGGPAALLAGARRRSAWYQTDLPGRRLPDRLATLLPGVGVVASSHAIAAEQRALWPRRDVTVIWPGIRPVQLPDDAGRRALRERHGVPAGKAVVGTIGRLLEWKGHHHVVAAAARLRARGHDVHALVVGGTSHGLEPEYEARLRAMVDDLGMADHATLTGHVPDGAALLGLMDVFVSASAREPFGIAVVEAMSAGVPVVAVDDAGPRESLDGGAAGVLAASNDPDVLATAIARLLDDAAEHRRMAEAGRRRSAVFTDARMVRELEDWVERTAARAAQRAS